MNPYEKFEEMTREDIIALTIVFREKAYRSLDLAELPKQALIWAVKLICEAMRNNLTSDLHDAFILHLEYTVSFDFQDFLSVKDFYEYICDVISKDYNDIEVMNRVIQLDRFSRALLRSPLEGILFKSNIELPEENEVA